ncbi:MAG: DUF3347 domain-containing protein [Deltaproteobacteria bacterium]|nr:DUF3347 domain-containing protein [Deltaproteobacteria bacterium]
MKFSRLFIAAVALSACSKAAPPAEAPPAAPAAPAAEAAKTAQAPRVEQDSPRLRAGQEAIGAYAKVRAALAADNLADAKTAAGAAKPALEAAAAALPDAATELQHVGAALGAIAGAADMPGARQAFGDASKSMITVVASEKALQTGLVCYRCPMTKTYQKWLQTGDEMGNPYYGAEMLHCGGKVPIAP